MGELDSYVGSEVLAAVVMKSSILWHITPCSPSRPLTYMDYTEYIPEDIALGFTWLCTGEGSCNMVIDFGFHKRRCLFLNQVNVYKLEWD
jgi:hypothetical protein